MSKPYDQLEPRDPGPWWNFNTGFGLLLTVLAVAVGIVVVGVIVHG